MLKTMVWDFFESIGDLQHIGSLPNIDLFFEISCLSSKEMRKSRYQINSSVKQPPATLPGDQAQIEENQNLETLPKHHHALAGEWWPILTIYWISKQVMSSSSHLFPSTSMPPLVIRNRLPARQEKTTSPSRPTRWFSRKPALDWYEEYGREILLGDI